MGHFLFAPMLPTISYLLDLLLSRASQPGQGPGEYLLFGIWRPFLAS